MATRKSGVVRAKTASPKRPPRKAALPDAPAAGPDSPVAPNGVAQTSRLLSEANLLMQEGLKRIASAHTDLPGAQHPLQEALRMSEEQTITTLDAVEAGRSALREILQTRDAYIDDALSRIEGAFATILQCQQTQDLAGQRLKKAMSLMGMVQSRIAKALEDMPFDLPMCMSTEAGQTQGVDQQIEQGEVDALLAELGI